jgi:hypothetical protein
MSELKVYHRAIVIKQNKTKKKKKKKKKQKTKNKQTNKKLQGIDTETDR